MRAVFTLAVLLVACTGDDDVGGGAVDPPPVVEAELVEGLVQECVAPGLRSDRHFDRRIGGEQPMQEANLVGGGLIVDDFDGDGLLDLFLPSEQTVQLWYGSGDGGFDETDSALTGIDLSNAVGGSAVDYDADGDLDLFVLRWEQPNALLSNEGGRSWIEVAASVGLGDTALKSQSGSWADIDADGDLDLFVGSYGEWTIVDVNTPGSDCSDHVAEPAELYRNEGDGTFTDISDLLPDEVHDGYSFMSGWYDLDGDSYPELFSVHDDGGCAPSVLVDNEGGKSLSVDVESGFHPRSHDMGMAVADLNGDELPDFLLTSWKDIAYVESQQVPVGANGVVWAEPADDLGLVPKYGVGTAEQVYGWGAEFGDVDNDTDHDAVMVFGFWSTYDGAPLNQRDGLWLQDGGQFDNVAQADQWQVNDLGISRGVVLADVNNDGWLDMVRRQLNGPTLMDLSRCGEESWLRVRLEAPGANPRAIGAMVRVTVAGESQVRWLHSGSSGLYSGSPLEVHFGLGSAESIDRLDVVWPDASMTSFADVTPRQQLVVRRTR